jgi:hypothetical protein
MYALTRFFCVAVGEGEALDALLGDVLEAGHAAGARAREGAVQLVCPAGAHNTTRLSSPPGLPAHPRRARRRGCAGTSGTQAVRLQFGLEYCLNLCPSS